MPSKCPILKAYELDKKKPSHGILTSAKTPDSTCQNSSLEIFLCPWFTFIMTSPTLSSCRDWIWTGELAPSPNGFSSCPGLEIIARGTVYCHPSPLSQKNRDKTSMPFLSPQLVFNFWPFYYSLKYLCKWSPKMLGLLWFRNNSQVIKAKLEQLIMRRALN